MNQHHLFPPHPGGARSQAGKCSVNRTEECVRQAVDVCVWSTDKSSRGTSLCPVWVRGVRAQSKKDSLKRKRKKETEPKKIWGKLEIKACLNLLVDANSTGPPCLPAFSQWRKQKEKPTLSNQM